MTKLMDSRKLKNRNFFFAAFSPSAKVDLNRNVESELALI